ncbi:MAG: hypothetical protein COA73_04195 [Candidatus Hydrogenedentota bacterium]|nr:MAG: hypothetical protein COA73_04195 [Candidatus Hydrogenedentota bacterium]
MADEASSVTKLVLFSVLAFTVIGGVYVHHDAQKLKQGLKSQAQSLIDEFTSDSDVDALDATATITATRKYILFGEPKGKITVYLRNNLIDEHPPETHEEEEAGNSHQRKYSGIEYLYSKQEDEWSNTESGQCAEERCQINAKRAFELTGI